MRPPDAAALGRAHRLCALARPERGLAGQHFGRAAGTSLEFQEFRAYQPGDDLRRVDWRTYARTEVLHTRLHREEVSACFELVLDGSRSMELTPAKGALTRALAAFLAGAAAAEMQVRCVLAADRPQLLPAAALASEVLPGVAFDGARSLAEQPLGALLRSGSVRVLLSDFLFPHDPAALLEACGRGAGALLVLAVLDPGELDPPGRGTLRLREVESGRTRDAPLDDRAVARYRQRLARLWEGLQQSARARGGLALRCSAAQALPALVSEVLVPAGVVLPR